MYVPSSAKEKKQINIVLHDRKNKPTPVLQERSDHALGVIDRYFAPFIGLENMKTRMKEIYATHIIRQKRMQNGLLTDKQVLHMLFIGNPGTGKTTVARKLANLFFDLQLLSKGHFIEAERADIVGEYIGQTALKTRAMIQKALGGVLFIDEAYSLARGGHKDFGREAIDTLVKAMEDHADDFVLILAGYPKEMNYFLKLNPGLRSRFPFVIHFNDYTLDELMDIATQFLRDKEYELTPEAKWQLRQHLREQINRREENFANARYVRNIIEAAIRKQAFRIVNAGKFSYHDLLYIKVEDLPL